MPFLAAKTAAPTPGAPLYFFKTATGTASVYTRAAEIDPAFWAETFGEETKDFVYYQLLECTMSRGFQHRYLVLSASNGKPFALQPLIVVDQDLVISLGERVQAVVARCRRFLPRLLRSRMLMAGCLVGEGHLGVRKGFDRRAAVAALPEALFRFADREDISFLTVKDFLAGRRSEMEPLRAAGFTRLDGFPSLKLELNFDSFEQYARERLSRTTRKNLRRKFRQTATAPVPLTMEVRSDCCDVIEEIYPLYLAVAQRSEVQFEVFTRDYFVQASLTMPEHCRFFIWRQAGKAVAFSYCTVSGTTIWDNDIGLDYAVAHELNLYYISFRDIIEWALAHGYRTYRSTPFNYDPKMHLRLELEPVDLFVRHRSPLVNALLRRFAPFFAPAKSDPVLRRHFSAKA